MGRRKICVVTGSRAEYGLLYWIMRNVEVDPNLELQIVATGMHLSPEFGLTYRIIEEDGFSIAAKVEMLLSGDTTVAVTKSLGLGCIEFASTFEQLRPDIVVLLGDRFEMLAAAQAAFLARIPIAHIAGGDVTEAALDEAIRHSITKMSHIHFVTNKESGKRVRQLGENPENVYVVGHPGLDFVERLTPLSKEEVERRLRFSFRKRNVLVTFHPVTLDENPAEKPFGQLLDALHKLGSDVGIILTKPNADPFGRALMRMIDDFVSQHRHSVVHTSLGQELYLSTALLVDAVVGNSSSGILEIPSLKVPTVNIGDRQKGRIRAASVIDCAPNAVSIESAIQKAFTLDCSKVTNPYGDGNSASRIVSVLKTIDFSTDLIKKKFFDLDFHFKPQIPAC